MATVTDKAQIKFSTQGRAGVPDGNIYVDHTDPANPKIEVLAVSEVPTVDFGAGPVANPVDDNDGVSLRAIYGASVENRNNDDAERHFLRPARGVFAPAGAYDLINNTQFSTDADRGLIRSSGIRYIAGTDVNRIYFGPKSLGNVQPLSQSTYQTAEGGASTDFARLGPVDELVQVFGTTAFGDTGAGDFDVRSYFAVSVRTWGFTYDRKTLADSGFASAENFSGGFGLSESPHPTTGNYTEADVFGGAAIAPFASMDYTIEAAPITRTGFNEADGDFSFTIPNPNGGSLDEVVAWMDGYARATGIDDDVLYAFDTQGNIVLKQGLYIENLPGADLIRVRARDDADNVKTFPTVNTIKVNISTPAQGDADAWYEAFIVDDTDGDDYNTASAITAQDKDGVEIKGLVGASAAISFDVNFSQPPGGSNIAANTPYAIRFLVGPGDPVANGDPVENFIVIQIDGTSKTVDLTNDVEQNV